MFEAAKNRFYPEVFSTEEAARHYIGDAKADDVRPWIRRTDVKPMKTVSSSSRARMFRGGCHGHDHRSLYSAMAWALRTW